MDKNWKKQPRSRCTFLILTWLAGEIWKYRLLLLILGTQGGVEALSWICIWAVWLHRWELVGVFLLGWFDERPRKPGFLLHRRTLFNIFCLWLGCRQGQQPHFLQIICISKLSVSELVSFSLWHTVCFLDIWPQTKCRVTFDTIFWHSFLCPFTWYPRFCFTRWL